LESILPIICLVLAGGIAIILLLTVRRLSLRNIIWVLASACLVFAVLWFASSLLISESLTTPRSENFSYTLVAILLVCALTGVVLASPAFKWALETEARAHKKASVYETLFENSHLGMYRTTPDGSIIKANTALLNMLEFDSLEELSKRNLEEYGFGPGYSREQFKALVERPEGVKGLEAAWTRKDGTTIYIRENAVSVRDESGKVLYYEGTVEDITDKVEAERKIRESEARYRALVELAPVGIVVYRDMKGVYANNAAKAIMRMTEQQFIGQYVLRFVHPQCHELAKERISKALTEGTPQPLVELVYVRPDGSHVDVEVATSSIIYEGKKAVITVFRDISERKKAKKLEEELKAAQKMEALGRLAGGIAHDFNNMLTAILGYSSMLVSDLEKSSPAYAYASQIADAAKRASSLTGQLLAFSRRIVLEPKVLDINDVIMGMKNLIGQLTGVNIELVLNLNAKPATISADQGQIEQVLVNLAINAKDAMPDGGVLEIITESIEMPDTLKTSVLPPSRWVRISVGDTGLGMSEDVKARIFEPFFSTKDHEQRTGLGLSTVYGIIKQWKGMIEVQSAPGKGTRFDIYFPVAEERVERKVRTEKEEETEAVVGKGETIMVVEDEGAVREIAASYLRHAGYSVIEAQNGEEALGIVSKLKPSIDILVTDVVMPKINGPELVKAMSQMGYHPKVIYMSAYPKDHLANEGDFGCGKMFLQKPFLPNQLARAIREILRANLDS
jgi:PAS domain S-box-containing protein